MVGRARRGRPVSSDVTAEVARFLDQLHDLHVDGRKTDELDCVFDTLDDAMVEGRFAFVDAVLRSFDPARMSLPAALSVLTVAVWGKDRLTEREGAVARVSQHILALGRGADHDALMRGLR